MSSPLGNLEQILLFAILRSGGVASGADIREEVRAKTGRSVSPGAVYTVMARLEQRGFVTGEIGGPAPARGGRRRKFYRLEQNGADALATAYDHLTSMAHGVIPKLREIVQKGAPG